MFSPLRVPVLSSGLLKIRRPSQMPTREHSAPLSAWSCRHCHQNCAPASIATLVPMPPPPGMACAALVATILDQPVPHKHLPAVPNWLISRHESDLLGRDVIHSTSDWLYRNGPVWCQSVHEILSGLNTTNAARKSATNDTGLWPASNRDRATGTT